MQIVNLPFLDPSDQHHNTVLHPLHSSPFKSSKKMQIHCIIVAWYATLSSLFCMLNHFSYVMNQVSERSTSWSILLSDCIIHFTGYLWNPSNVHCNANTITLFLFPCLLILWLVQVSYLNCKSFENVSIKSVICHRFTWTEALLVTLAVQRSLTAVEITPFLASRKWCKTRKTGPERRRCLHQVDWWEWQIFLLLR